MSAELVKFRANNPGAIEELEEKATDKETERCTDICELCETAGAGLTEARDLIRTGVSAADAVPRLSRLASRSDERAAAFVKKVEQLRIGTDVAALAGVGPQTAAALALVQQMGSTRGRAPASPGRAQGAGARDLGDEVADRVEARRGIKPKSAAASSGTEQSQATTQVIQSGYSGDWVMHGGRKAVQP
jgi:hypothetical protein